MERLVRYSLWRDGRKVAMITAAFGEPAPGYQSGAYLDVEMSMRATTTTPVLRGDTLAALDGERYRVGRVERLGRRFVFELARES